MQSRWNDAEAAQFVERIAPEWGEQLALRVYSSRLIGGDPSLVLHGGGNTSVKGRLSDLLGDEREVIFVKGSGWDLAGIEPAGLPALDLPCLRRLRALEDLSDEEMVNQLRTHLLDASAPSPSIETLLHAFLPHRFVDHSHAVAVLTVGNRERGEQMLAEALGPGVAAVPYIKPGFPLAKAVAAAVEAQPQAEGVVLHHHGLFTFGDTARESYERHVALVDAAERFLAAHPPGRTAVRVPAALPAAAERAAALAPVLRGALARSAAGMGGRFLLEWRADEELLGILAAPEARDHACTPPLTPDHSIRTKNLPLWAGAAAGESGAEELRAALEEALREYASGYREYFERGVKRFGARQALDPAPRVILVPGCGLFGAGGSARAAAVAADLGEQNLRGKAAGAGLGPYRGLDEMDLFDVEYWSLEQAKLGRGTPAELAGQVAVITGGGGAVGEGVATILAQAGAETVLLDTDPERAAAAAERIRAAGGRAWPLTADVTDPASLQAAFDEVCRRCGGVDVLVPNAGIAQVSSIVDTAPGEYRRVVEVNQTGVLLTLQAGGRVMLAQGTGGSVVIVSSKNVLSPGADFGSYSSSKAGAHQLGRVAALEWARHGIHVNMVCPDAVFRCGDNPSGLWSEVGPGRARARGLKPEELESFYVERNLLRRTVSAEEVGRAVLFFAARRTPTTGAVLPVDGGIPAAFPR